MTDFQYADINDITSGRVCLVVTRLWCSLNILTPENAVKALPMKFSHDPSVSYICNSCADLISHNLRKV